MAYDNPGGIIAMTIILGIFAAGSVTMRFTARHKKRVRPATDDWLILAGLLFGIGLFVMEIYGVATRSIGYPLSVKDKDPGVTKDRTARAKKLEFAYLLVGITAMCLVKTSITTLYKRIFQKPGLALLFNIWIVLLVTSAATFVILGLAGCRDNLSALFASPQEEAAQCIPQAKTSEFYVAITLATDFITIVIPIPLIWSLQMPTRRKFAVIGIFMIAFLSFGASIARAYILILARAGDFLEKDPLTTLSALSIWNYVETTIAIFVACAPVMPPALPHFRMLDNLSSMVRSLRQIPSQEGDPEHFSTSPKHDACIGRSISHELLVLRNPGHSKADLESATTQDTQVLNNGKSVVASNEIMVERTVMVDRS